MQTFFLLQVMHEGGKEFQVIFTIDNFHDTSLHNKKERKF